MAGRVCVPGERLNAQQIRTYKASGFAGRFYLHCLGNVKTRSDLYRYRARVETYPVTGCCVRILRPPVGKIFRCRQIGGKRPKTGRSCGLFAPRGEIWRAGVGRLRKKAYFCLLLNGGTESRQTGTEPGRSCSPCGARLPGRTPGNRSGEVRFFHPLRLSDRFSR